MSQIDIRHAHTMSPPQARNAVQEVVEMLAQRFGVVYGWDGDVMNFNRAGIDGHIALLPHELHVSAQLGFMLSMMKTSIESEIRRVLSDRFH